MTTEYVWYHTKGHMAVMDAATLKDHSERKGHLFREKPFYLSVIYMRTVNESVKELILREFVNEHDLYVMLYGIEEPRQ